MKQEMFDVVVVGSGAGGLCAAIAARLSGLSAVVLEKEALWGGATAVSGGAVWVPDNHVARRGGAQDSIDAARTYLQALCGDQFDEMLVERYLDAGPRVVEFLESRTAVRFTSPQAYPDYQSELEGAGSRRVLRPERFDGRLLGPWFETLRWPLRETMLYGRVSIAPEDVPHLLGMTTSVRSAAYVSRLLLRYAADRMAGAPRGMKLANGNALAARLGKSAFDLGIALWLESPVRRLLVEQGRVVGVVVERTGTSVELRARRGVVLATGGFANDPGYRRRFHAHVARGSAHYTLVPPGSTSDGLRFGVEVGVVPGIPAGAPRRRRCIRHAGRIRVSDRRPQGRAALRSSNSPKRRDSMRPGWSRPWRASTLMRNPVSTRSSGAVKPRISVSWVIPATCRIPAWGRSIPLRSMRCRYFPGTWPPATDCVSMRMRG